MWCTLTEATMKKNVTPPSPTFRAKAGTLVRVTADIRPQFVDYYRPVARLTERGVHTKNMWASGHMTYNLMNFKLSMLVLKYSHHTRLVGGQRP